MFSLIQSFCCIAADLKDRNTGDAIGGQLQFAAVFGTHFPIHIDRYLSVCTDAGGFHKGRIFHFQLDKCRNHRDYGVAKGFCQIIAGAVGALYRSCFSAASTAPPVRRDSRDSAWASP